MDYQKYLKYKIKYFNLKKILHGGDESCKTQQNNLVYENKSPIGEILEDTNVFEDKDLIKVIFTLTKKDRITVIMTENKAHYISFNSGKGMKNGWIPFNSVTCNLT
jgi:hypothetical protein